MSVLYLFFFNFRRGGTSEERENMLSRGQGMVGNQDTMPCGLLGGLVGGLIDGWVGRSVVGWMDGWMGWWMGGCKSHYGSCWVSCWFGRLLSGWVVEWVGLWMDELVNE